MNILTDRISLKDAFTAAAEQLSPAEHARLDSVYILDVNTHNEFLLLPATLDLIHKSATQHMRWQSAAGQKPLVMLVSDNSLLNNQLASNTFIIDLEKGSKASFYQMRGLVDQGWNISDLKHQLIQTCKSELLNRKACQMVELIGMGVNVDQMARFLHTTQDEVNQQIATLVTLTASRNALELITWIKSYFLRLTSALDLQHKTALANALALQSQPCTA